MFVAGGRLARPSWIINAKVSGSPVGPLANVGKPRPQESFDDVMGLPELRTRHLV
jgi:hypothetical protein